MPEKIVERLRTVAGDNQAIHDIAFLEGAQRQRFVHRIVLDEQNDFFIHGLEPLWSTDWPPSSVKKKVAPDPTSPSAQIRPPCRRTTRSTVANPMPVPSNSLTECRR